MTPRTLLPALVAALGLLLAGCGDDADRPSAGAISDKLQEAGIDEGSADCAADVLHGSDISDGALADFVDADLDDPDADIDSSTGDDDAFDEVSDAYNECLVGAVDLPDVDVPATEPEG